MEDQATNHCRRSRSRVRFPPDRTASEGAGSSDPTVLIYHDIRLKVSDVDTLGSTGWINDQIISFYFQYLESHVYRNNSQHILLVSAQVTQLLKMSEGRHEDARQLLESLDFQSKHFFFFPLNNSDGAEEEGTHWSLLVYSRPENTFYTFDSIDKRNNYAATKLVEVLRVALNCPTAYSIYFPSAQQQNCYDCGIFVICNAENIINHIVNGCGEVRSVPKLNREAVPGKRSAIRTIIETLGGAI